MKGYVFPHMREASFQNNLKTLRRNVKLEVHSKVIRKNYTVKLTLKSLFTNLT